MSFISAEFALLFVIFSVLFYFIPQRFKILYLLIASLGFYLIGNHLFSTSVLVGSTLLDFWLTRRIGLASQSSRRKMYLFLSLLMNVGLLIILKFPAYFTNIFTELFHLISPFDLRFPSLRLPVGLSFYTFIRIGYAVDVYQRRIEPCNRLTLYGAFVSLFPYISAGPIERAEHMIPQLERSVQLDEDRTVEGLQLILKGFFKKAVVAAHLGTYVNGVYGNLDQYYGLPLLIAIVFYAFQIYADFSGYTDIARGLARIIGFDLFENFEQPYFAQSVTEFWRRWHMSLTNWIRIYLYFPLTRYLIRLSNRRYMKVVQVISYLIIMSIIGFWHGANWPFIVWGGLHGIYLAIESALPVRLRQPGSRPITIVLKRGITFVAVCFAWIFFRAETLTQARYVISHLFVFPVNLIGDATIFSPFAPDLGNWIGGYSMLFAFLLIVLLLGLDRLESTGNASKMWRSLSTPVRWGLYYVTLIMVVWGFQAASGTTESFIYFQF